jgi:hypothetical protein
MKEKFELSEKYRKYFIGIIIDGFTYYTVWGTDLNDRENDKLLVENEKLILFREVSTFKMQISNYKNVFLDKENFENWVKEESFHETYNSTNLTSLSIFSDSDLQSKESAFDIINSLNLLQDFYIQINKNDKAFSSELILDFKDNLYNNHFWKNNNFELNENSLEVNVIKIELKKIYNEFLKEIKFV